MRRLPRATWIAIVVTAILTMLGSLMGNIGANALTWLSPWVALALFGLISLCLIGVSLWQAAQNPASEPSATDTGENRQIMLGRVQNKWITGFLENPLYYSYDEQLLPLSLRQRVGSRFDLVLSNPQEQTQTILSGTTLAQVFDQARGELLILGEPGAGKTTLLLELARDLLKRAKDNPMAPIPVVLMLSSWATRKLPLEQWIAEELQAKYDIPSQIGKEWVKANQLLLLLDGLDEVAPSALFECIKAINDYYHQPHRSLVVCSRTKEFLDQPGRLALHTAVIVQPLSSEQVDTYLDGLAAKGEEVEGLKHTLHESEALRELATTPFFLTVLILAYHGKPPQELLALVKATPTNQLHLLFHNYIERVLQQKGTRIHVSAQQTKHWLAWLARQMIAHYQSELYLEQLQPHWLPMRRRNQYRWSSGLLGRLVGVLLFGLPGGLVGVLLFGLPGGLVGVLLFGLVGVLDFGLSHKPDTEIELTLVGVPTITLPGRGLGVLGTVGGLRFELGSGPDFEPIGELGFGLVSGLVGVLLFGLGFGLVGGLRFGLVGGLGFGLVGGLGFGLVGGLRFGLYAAVRRYLLRFWLVRSGVFPWRAVPFLEDAVEQLLLRKVGRGYIFRHRLLQDYFASLDDVPPQDPSVHAEARSVLQNAPNGDPSV